MINKNDYVANAAEANLESAIKYYGEVNEEVKLKLDSELLFQAIQYMFKNNKNQLAILENKIISIEKIGYGNFNKVQACRLIQQNSNTGLVEEVQTKEAFKEPRKCHSGFTVGFSKTEIDYEFDILSYLSYLGNKTNTSVENKNDLQKNVLGIQECSKRAATLSILKKDSPGEITKSEGYIIKRYKGDYCSLLKDEVNNRLSIDDRLMVMYQLLHGMAFMHQAKVLHGDIKLENIFYEKDSEGFYCVVIGDFGGATLHSNIFQQIQASRCAGTADYTSTEDGSKTADAIGRIRARFQLRRFIDIGYLNTLIQVTQKKDVFAMGMCLYRIMHNDTSMQVFNRATAMGQPVIASGFKKIPSSDIPHTVKEIIERMLEEHERSSSKEAFEKFSNYLQEHHQDVYVKLAEKCASYATVNCS